MRKLKTWYVVKANSRRKRDGGRSGMRGPAGVGRKNESFTPSHLGAHNSPTEGRCGDCCGGCGSTFTFAPVNEVLEPVIGASRHIHSLAREPEVCLTTGREWSLSKSIPKIVLDLFFTIAFDHEDHQPSPCPKTTTLPEDHHPARRPPPCSKTTTLLEDDHHVVPPLQPHARAVAVGKQPPPPR